MKSGPLTAEALRNFLSYDEKTGEFVWIANPKHGKRRLGNRTGFINASGYLAIGIFGKKHPAHRLAWLYVYGAWPNADIDHINGDRTDNRIENLRDVTRQTNMENMRGPTSRNKSGFMGVSFHNVAKRWRASIRANGKTMRLGYYDTPEEAHQVYLVAKREFHVGCTI